MRIVWRGLELPGRVVRDDSVSNDLYGRCPLDPFEQGFGTTIGNSLRRVLLSSLEGAAVTSVKIAGVSHEFVSIDGVLEDVTDILLNIKGIVLRLDGEGLQEMTVQRETAGEVRAGDIVAGPAATIANPDYHISTLTADVPFRVEMTANTGRGYATANDNRSPDQELGVIPIDSVYSPVVRVRYRTENMRVGQRVNYDRLILDVWTKGTVLPEDALLEAGMILRKHLNPFVMLQELGEEVVTPSRATIELSPAGDSAAEELLNKPVSILNLSVRASNCLDAARILTLRDLVTKTEGDLLRVRSFGKTSLHEVQRKLAELNFSLGMKIGETGAVTEQQPQGPTSTGDQPQMPTSADESATTSQPPAEQAEGSSANPGSGPVEVFTLPE